MLSLSVDRNMEIRCHQDTKESLKREMEKVIADKAEYTYNTYPVYNLYKVMADPVIQKFNQMIDDIYQRFMAI